MREYRNAVLLMLNLRDPVRGTFTTNLFPSIAIYSDLIAKHPKRAFMMLVATIALQRSHSKETTNMRHITFAAGLALATAALFATAPARAEFGGPLVNEQGLCRQYGAENQNLTYYYWDKCPSEVTRHGHTHAIRTTLPHHRS